jgi:hypothetical protein
MDLICCQLQWIWDLGPVGAKARGNELGWLQASYKIENSVVTTGSNSCATERHVCCSALPVSQTPPCASMSRCYRRERDLHHHRNLRPHRQDPCRPHSAGEGERE